MNRIPVAGPWITQREIDYVADAAANAWYENANVYTRRFEEKFAAYLGVKYAVALPSCTSAIHLSLMALGIGAGDEVIVPDATWIASAAPISYVGASPVFADIDKDSWCIDPRSVDACMSPRVKAILPVDLYGNMPDMETLRLFAGRHHLAIIEDAAEAVGSEFRGRKAGSLGHIGVFSFHGTKTLTTGEGGMLVTNDDKIYDRVQYLRDHGRQPGNKMFWNTEIAHKYKMSSLQAALGLAQLERIDELISRKRQIFDWYREDLAQISEVILNSQREDTKNTYWMVTAAWDRALSISKEEVIRLMGEKSIDCRPFFYPLSSLPAYQHLEEAARARLRNLVSYEITDRAINLPSSMRISRDEVRYVAQSLKEILFR